MQKKKKKKKKKKPALVTPGLLFRLERCSPGLLSRSSTSPPQPCRQVHRGLPGATSASWQWWTPPKWAYPIVGQNSYVLYCTVLYCTVLYCTAVCLFSVRYCTSVGSGGPPQEWASPHCCGPSQYCAQCFVCLFTVQHCTHVRSAAYCLRVYSAVASELNEVRKSTLHASDLSEARMFGFCFFLPLLCAGHQGSKRNTPIRHLL